MQAYSGTVIYLENINFCNFLKDNTSLTSAPNVPARRPGPVDARPLIVAVNEELRLAGERHLDAVQVVVAGRILHHAR